MAAITSQNCYVTLAEADEHFSDSLFSDTWTALTDSQKSSALITATRKIDTLKFGGSKFSSTQELEWPRDYVYNRDGHIITGLPKQIKWAVCEQASYDLSQSDRIASDFELENFKSVSLGPISYSTYGTANTVCKLALEFISSIGPGVVSSGRATKMVR